MPPALPGLVHVLLGQALHAGLHELAEEHGHLHVLLLTARLSEADRRTARQAGRHGSAALAGKTATTIPIISL